VLEAVEVAVARPAQGVVLVEQAVEVQVALELVLQDRLIPVAVAVDLEMLK
jgi:hypothetical protein